MNDGTAAASLVNLCHILGECCKCTFGGLASSLYQRVYCLLEAAARAEELFAKGIVCHFGESIWFRLFFLNKILIEIRKE